MDRLGGLACRPPPRLGGERQNPGCRGRPIGSEFFIEQVAKPQSQTQAGNWRDSGCRTAKSRRAARHDRSSDLPFSVEGRPLAAKFLRQLQISGVAGVRVYGRRAGQKQPLWRYAIDLRTAVDEKSAAAPAQAPSQLAVLEKEPVPEFAPAEDGSFSGLGENLVFDAPVPNSWRPRFKIRLPGYNLGEQLVQAAVQPLVASGLFVPNDGLSTNAAEPGA